MATTTRMCGSRSWRRDVPKHQVDKFTAARDVKSPINKQQKQEDRLAVCTYWMSDRCVYGEKCRYLHSWVLGDGVARIAQLRGHKQVHSFLLLVPILKFIHSFIHSQSNYYMWLGFVNMQAVSGITLPSCSDKLFTGSSDGTLRLWDCSTGKCDEKKNVFSMGTEVGCLISEGPLVFIGVLNGIWAWNIETCATSNLTGPVGQVHAMAVANQTLFAACQNGDILAWKPCLETQTFKLVAKLSGHTKAVLSLSVGGDRLYSGSADDTIRVWDIHTFQCIQPLSGHSGPVTCLICWDSYLISGSLDATLKVWVCEQDGKIEEFYSQKEQQGILALNGVTVLVLMPSPSSSPPAKTAQFTYTTCQPSMNAAGCLRDKMSEVYRFVKQEA
uniref:C3H1-type domain-containing protein n=1 Tax=Kalanchoe fedtschenkoi TaxID=63787 RepID=A0A7N0ZVE7_KALFE